MGTSLSVVVACKGRRMEAEQFVPAVLSVLGPDDELVVTDYDCPDRVTEYLVGLKEPRLTVVRFAPAAWFHPNHARNLGCRYAVNSVLVQGDIDKSVSAALVTECRGLAPGEFLAQPPRVNSWGFTCLWYSDFYRVHGWEEAMAGYGYDDFYMRESLCKSGLRMHLCGAVVEELAHTDNRRIYPDDRRTTSHHVNMRIGKSVRIYHPFEANYARNWGAGGVVIVESETRKRDGKAKWDWTNAWWTGGQCHVSSGEPGGNSGDVAVPNGTRVAAVQPAKQNNVEPGQPVGGFAKRQKIAVGRGAG